MSSTKTVQTLAEVSAPQELLAVDHIAKAFGETKALVDAHLVIRAGEIHALAGENGSGKTTLIKTISGIVKPDSGVLRWKGTQVSIRGPITSGKLGISTVFQETLFAAEQSVIDNIYMGLDGMLRRRHSRKEEEAGSTEILNALGAEYIDIHAPLWSLSLAERQIVTIARSVVRPWSLLILDEGTSALDSRQRDRLFDYLRAAREEGKSVLFTSHRMDEMEILADSVSVLRSGTSMLTAPMSDLSPEAILASMAGRDMSETTTEPQGRKNRAGAIGRPVLTATMPDSRGQARDITVHAGEIFGLAGLEGQGQSSFLQSLAGLVKPLMGAPKVHVPGGGEALVRNFRDARKLKIAYVPKDRKSEGLFFSRSTLDNFSIAMLPGVSRLGVFSPRTVKKRFDQYVPIVKLLAHRPSNLIGTLSGGNQQKVLLARWLATEPDVLLLNDSTRGVDANTKAELHTMLRELADQGLAIILLSTEIMELLALCDQIAVFHDQRVETVLDGSEATDTSIVAAMFGHTDDQEGGE